MCNEEEVVKMNQIATTATNAVSVQQHVKNPLLIPSIRHNSDDEIFYTVLAGLARSFTDLGLAKPSDQDQEYMANSLADSIPRRFPSIRLHEINEAWAMGVRGKFGKFYGLNVVSFENFIEAYLNLETREQFARELPKLEETVEPDDLTKFNLSKFNALEALRRKNSGLDISLSAVTVYNFLDSLKLISFSIEEKYDFIDQARRQLVEEFKRKSITAKDAIDRKANKKQASILSDVVADSLVINQSTKTQILNRSKCLALEAFLETCILEDTNLEELIETKKQDYLTLLNSQK